MNKWIKIVFKCFKYELKTNNNISNIIILFIIMNLIIPINSNDIKVNNNKRKLNNDNYIILKVKIIGSIVRILSNNIYDISNIYLNEQIINYKTSYDPIFGTNSVYVNITSEGIIKIKLNKKLTSTYKLFYNCKDLI